MCVPWSSLSCATRGSVTLRSVEWRRTAPQQRVIDNLLPSFAIDEGAGCVIPVGSASAGTRACLLDRCARSVERAARFEVRCADSRRSWARRFVLIILPGQKTIAVSIVDELRHMLLNSRRANTDASRN